MVDVADDGVNSFLKSHLQFIFILPRFQKKIDQSKIETHIKKKKNRKIFGTNSSRL